MKKSICLFCAKRSPCAKEKCLFKGAIFGALFQSTDRADHAGVMFLADKTPFLENAWQSWKKNRKRAV